MNQIFYPKPRPIDFLISGEILNIKIDHTSFTVTSQFYNSGGMAYSLDVNHHIYPIRFLSQFFKKNATKPTSYYIKRADVLMQP